MPHASAHYDGEPDASGNRHNPDAASYVLRACHSALFPGALLRCGDADLAGSGPLNAVVAFPDGSTTTATYTNNAQGPQLTVDPYQTAAGQQRGSTTWLLHQSAPSVLRLRHLAEHTRPRDLHD